MNTWINYRIKTWHLGVVFIIMVLVTNVMGVWGLNNYPQGVTNFSHIELDEVTLKNSELADISFILFYDERSQLSTKVEYNLNELQKAVDSNIGFYKLNVNECTKVHNDYNISGIPCVLVFKEGKEVERIMGVTSMTNLNKVYERIIK